MTSVIEFPSVKSYLKLDLGCGNNKKEGFSGVDFVKEGTQADYEHNLNRYPWPFEDQSVDEVFSSHYFEHVDGPDRGKFMDELYRIMVPGGKAVFVTPFGWNNRALQDFTHKFPPIIPESYLYFCKKWRDLQNLNHGFYNLKCDFEIVSAKFVINPEMTNKDPDYLTELIKHSINVADDLVVELKRL